MRILIDMDEVMADAIQQFLDWYERDFGVRYTKADLHGSRLRDIVPEKHRDAVAKYPHQKGFFKDLPLIAHSQEVISELNEQHEVYVASAAMEFEYSLPEKYEWLDKNFPFIHWKRRIFCGDKSVLHADVLIDDHDFNLSVFRGKPVIFSAPHNLEITKYERLHAWPEARKMFNITSH